MASLPVRFCPGFVLDDAYGALTSLGADDRALIHAHPEHVAEAARRYFKRPLHFAAFVHSMACHELAHANGLMGQGHSPAFVRARKNLVTRTRGVVPELARRAISLLGLGPLRSSSPAAVAAASQEVCSDTSADCRECSTCPLEALPKRRHKAQQLADQLADHVRENPPAGLSRRAVDRFIQRNADVLLEMAEEIATAL